MTKTTKQKSESVFDHLRVLEFSDGEARQDFNKTVVYADTDNTVEIFTAEIKPGKWAWGYNFYTKNGRNEFRFPSLEYGYCRSERDAKLIVEASETPSFTSLVCYSPMALCSLATLCSLLVTRLRNFNN